MDRGDVFAFYSKSADRLPGKGSGESLEGGDPNKYRELSLISDWRKMLSNFYLYPIELDGLMWASVEHYYQGSKFKKENPNFYLQFSLSCPGILSSDPATAKGAGGKTGKVGGKQFRPGNIHVDSDFFTGGRDVIEMHKAQDVKFKIPLFSKVLKLTAGADLIHFVGRNAGYVRCQYLMDIRDKL